MPPRQQLAISVGKVKQEKEEWSESETKSLQHHRHCCRSAECWYGTHSPACTLRTRGSVGGGELHGDFNNTVFQTMKKI